MNRNINIIVFFCAIASPLQAIASEKATDVLKEDSGVSSDDSTSQPFNDWLWDYLTKGASVTAGIGGRSTNADVTRVATGDKGKLADKRENALFLTYSTRANYFKDSNFGYSWLFNVSTFRLHKQEINNNTDIDLGTEVKGYFAYVVPAFFYNIGDKRQGHYLRPGIGLGLGLAHFNGDIILTDSTISNDRIKISNGFSNLYFALGLFIDYQFNNFAIRLSSGGPNINDGKTEINFSDTSLMFGYTYYLNL